MISVEQIHRLENRIERALGMLADLRETNAALTSQLQAANAGAVETARKLEESESARVAAEQRLSQLRTDQEEIEATINRTLHQLDELEVDLSVQQEDSPPAPTPAESEPGADVAASAAAAQAEDSLTGEPAEQDAAAPEPDAAAQDHDAAVPDHDAVGEEQSAEADATTTTEEEAAPSREGAELDIF